MMDEGNLSRRTVLRTIGVATATGVAVPAAANHDDEPDGYPETCDGPGFNNTPVQPWSGWRFGDACRPLPPVVDPGEVTFGEPPADATVLLGDGSSGEITLDDWESAEGEPSNWVIKDGYIQVNVSEEAENQWLQSKEDIGDAHYHIEWRVPADVTGSGQDSGNSGVWLASNYEIQVLNSYENPTYADGMAGALYGDHPPLVNAARPPGEWQKYDIVWHAPRFSDSGEVESPGVVTVYWNGVLVQTQTVFHGSTPYKALPEYSPHPPEMPLQLQYHSQPVQYRNIWYESLPSPGSILEFDGDQLTTEDQTTNLEASISNTYSSEITSVDVTLASPENSGVKVNSKGKTSFGSVAAASSESVSWTIVTPPPAEDPPYLLTASLSYVVGGEQKEISYRVPLYPEPDPENDDRNNREHPGKGRGLGSNPSRGGR